ncbi:MAG: alpha/beta hydrolase [Chitinophagaceae bacterium]|nr:alpha/beta hydrolase [Chitinophagaceae bacterium]
MTQKSLQTQKHEIFYRITGTGKPVVFIHGFGEYGSIWDLLTDDLKDQFQCIVPDLPGSGKSLMKKGDWTMEDLAEAIKSVLDHEKIENPVLIGHSMGGYISLAFAEKYGENMAGLCLFHSSAFADSEEKKATRERGIQFIEEHGPAKFLEQSTPNLFSNEFKSLHPDIVKDLIDRYTNFQDAALVHYYQAMMQRPDRTHILKNYPGPVLFILGEHDTAIPLADGLKQCHLPRLSYIHILKKSGHMGMIEETDKCREILQNFLHGR